MRSESDGRTLADPSPKALVVLPPSLITERGEGPGDQMNCNPP